MAITQPNTKANAFNQATQAFQNTIAMPAVFETPALETPQVGRFRPDQLLRMTIRGKTFEYYAEVKPYCAKTDEYILLVHKNELDKPILLIANYINPRVADRLKQEGIQFIDTAGNAFINNTGLFVFVKGNKPPRTQERQPIDRAFRPGGLKIIFAFLCNPGLENKPYREIAAAAGVALGTINRAMIDLEEMGFLLDLGKKGYKLVQKEKLLERWVTAYAEQLRPKLTLGCYRGEAGWWQGKKLGQWDAQWGGELAAAAWTDYLKPDLITIYTTHGGLNRLLLDNRLRRDADGDVEIVERFWEPEGAETKAESVHPILVYADLIATGNKRNIETAKLIYERDILRLVRED